MDHRTGPCCHKSKQYNNSKAVSHKYRTCQYQLCNHIHCIPHSWQRTCADAAVQALLDGSLGYDPEARCDHHDHAHGAGHTCGEHGCGEHSCHS